MKETVPCQVVYMERPGVTRRTEVPVEESAIRARCWREIACIKAAVYLEVSFAELLEKAKYGFRPEDKARLFGKGAAEQGTGNGEQATGDGGRGFLGSARNDGTGDADCHGPCGPSQ